MPRTGAQRRGTQREVDLINDVLAPAGWVCVRAAGSFGIDVVACAGGTITYHPAWEVAPHTNERHVFQVAHGYNILLFIEVKSTKAGPFSDFGPQARVALKDAARRAGAYPWLAWWPPHGELTWIPPGKWPKSPARGVKVPLDASVVNVSLTTEALPAAPPAVIGTPAGAVAPDRRGLARQHRKPL